MVNQEDIFLYARSRVDNKGVGARIGHSSKLHAVRSAFSSSGSAGSKFVKLLGVAARGTLQAIPVPVVGGLIAAVEKAVESKVREAIHHGRREQAADLATRVKFDLKDLSLEEMDRFRWKVTDSINECNKAIANFQSNYNKKVAAKATCDAYLDLAMAVEQVSRRIERLQNKCDGVQASIALTLKWLDECANGPTSGPPAVQTAATTAPGPVATGGVNGKKNQIRELIMKCIKDEAEEMDDEVNKFMANAPNPADRDRYREWYIAERHGKCGYWCCYRTAGAVDNYRTHKDTAAKVLRFLSEPFAPDDFYNNAGNLWKT